MNKYLEKLERYPIGISGTCLAFITLSNSWQLKGVEYLKPLAIALAVGMLLLMAVRTVRHPKTMIKEIKDPVVGTFYPTMGMVTWLVAAYFYPLFPKTCTALWLAAVVWHYGIVILYTYLRVKERNFKNLVPTMFIVYTGMITGTVASKGMVGVAPIANFMLLFGFVFYTALLPLVLFIVFRSEKMEDHKLPTVGIICSPAPLGIVGMLTMSPNPNKYMLGWLIISGLCLLPVVYTYIVKMFKDGFKPGHASFTFPLAIATLAAFKLGTYFSGLGYNGLGHVFTFLGNIEIFIATYVIFVVLYNFLKMFIKAINLALENRLERDIRAAEETILEETTLNDKLKEEKIHA